MTKCEGCGAPATDKGCSYCGKGRHKYRPREESVCVYVTDFASYRVTPTTASLLRDAEFAKAWNEASAREWERGK